MVPRISPSKKVRLKKISKSTKVIKRKRKAKLGFKKFSDVFTTATNPRPLSKPTPTQSFTPNNHFKIPENTGKIKFRLNAQIFNNIKIGYQETEQ